MKVRSADKRNKYHQINDSFDVRAVRKKADWTEYGELVLLSAGVQRIKSKPGRGSRGDHDEARSYGPTLSMTYCFLPLLEPRTLCKTYNMSVVESFSAPQRRDREAPRWCSAAVIKSVISLSRPPLAINLFRKLQPYI